MTIFAAVAAVSVNAQVYLGGSFAFEAWSSQKLAGDKSETVFAIMPEIGYNLNDNLAIGTVIGYQSNKFNGLTSVNGKSETAFFVNPYVRYTFANMGKVNMFVDSGVEFVSATKTDWTQLGVGFKPGLAISLTDNLSFVSHLGFIGWKQNNPDGDDNNTSMFGIDLSGADLSFGLYYNF